MTNKMKVLNFTFLMQIIFFTSWVSAYNTQGNDAKYEEVLEKIVEKTEDLETDLKSHNVTDVDTLHQMTDNFFQDIPHLLTKKFGRSGGAPTKEAFEEIQIMKRELQQIVLNARRTAEELLVKAEKQHITDGSQIKAVSKELIGKLKNNFNPISTSRRQSESVSTMIRRLQGLTSYGDFTEKMQGINIDPYLLRLKASFIQEQIMNYEAEAERLHKAKSVNFKVTLNLLLDETKEKDYFMEDKDFELLAKKYVINILIEYSSTPEILKMIQKFMDGTWVVKKLIPFAKDFQLFVRKNVINLLVTNSPEPGIIEMIARFINGLQLTKQNLEYFYFDYEGIYLPLLQTELMKALRSENTMRSKKSLQQ